MAKLDARVAALEAAQSDYRALLAAGNALGANQRDHASAIIKENGNRIARCRAIARRIGKPDDPTEVG